VRGDGASVFAEKAAAYFTGGPAPRAARYVIKAIDLESAVERGARLLDFSPEACAPEHALQMAEGAVRFAGGGGGYTLDLRQPLLADYPQDMWALGIAALWICSNRPPIVAQAGAAKQAVALVSSYARGEAELMRGAECALEPRLRSLLRALLQVTPASRPSSAQLAFALCLL
jgi:hypothetical protein